MLVLPMRWTTSHHYVFLLGLFLFLGISYFAMRNSHIMDVMVSRASEGWAVTGWFAEEPEKLLPWDVPCAKRYISAHPDHTSYHLLHALMRDHRRQFDSLSQETKAAVLCDALAHVRSFDDFGSFQSAGAYDDDAAVALINTGKAALPFLKQLLDDNSRAPLSGSRAATLSSFYAYRRSDFAYRYGCLIIGDTPTFESLPEERDKEIQRLKGKLEALGY